ncbi:MAG: TetR/AcrR family transcriptional regulator [Balneolaceae bacterium]|nr:TetR/AcrR family transcriptional regulator [Balneolaceae bacterium]MBO6545286.1 TetR/AcrR family transcriptional regulator [Balneolaceae bacterium]MBO6646682.1 TetR/AcrR family transcriptional regulator [Balneolaceae bacterium]
MTESQNMGIAERKERERELKRSMMLEAAEALIREKGLEHLNMDEVAERAEVSKGSLYQYFNNKTDLVLGICHKASIMMNTMTAKVLTEDKTGLEMVYQIGINYLKFAGEHPEFYRAMRFLENYKDTDQAKNSEYLSMCGQNRQESFRVMVRAIQIGMQDGSINSSYNPEELALLLWSTSHGVVNMAYMHQNAEHFKLLDHLGIDLETIFNGYMKLIGQGMEAKQC